MPLKDLVLRRKEKKVLFCFVEKTNLQVSTKKSVKSTNSSQCSGSSKFTIFLKTHPDSFSLAVYNLIY